MLGSENKVDDDQIEKCVPRERLMFEIRRRASGSGGARYSERKGDQITRPHDFVCWRNIVEIGSIFIVSPSSAITLEGPACTEE